MERLKQWAFRVRDWTAHHLFFLTMLCLSAYIFFGVDQITNIWMQWPPLGIWWVYYSLFLVPVLFFYIGSCFVVLRISGEGFPQMPPALDGGASFRSRAKRGLWRFLWPLLVPLPEMFSRLLACVTTPPQETTRRLDGLRLAIARFFCRPRGASITLTLGLLALGGGAGSDSSLAYPLVGSFCRGLGLILTLVGFWLQLGCDHSWIRGESLTISGRRRALRMVVLLAGFLALMTGIYWDEALSPYLGFACRKIGLILIVICFCLYADSLSDEAGTRHKQSIVFLTLGIIMLIGSVILDASGYLSIQQEQYIGWLLLSIRAIRSLGIVFLGVGFCMYSRIAPRSREEVSEEGAVVQEVPAPPQDRHPDLDMLPAGWYVGRMLSWLMLTACTGEVFWFLAGKDLLGKFISYRLYTIWAVLQALTFFMLLGLLVDRLSYVYSKWPIRLLALGLVVFGFWSFTSWETLTADDVEHHLTREQVAKARAQAAREKKDPEKEAKNRAGFWFEQLRRRIKEIPKGEGPVVLVAASGGGSRAAIFTALALEELRRTPLDPAKPLRGAPEQGARTWADNIVLISSVSGGSLATAYYVHDLDQDPTAPLPINLKKSGAIDDLRNTTSSELITRLARIADEDLEDYPTKLARQLNPLLTNHSNNPENENQQILSILRGWADRLQGLGILHPDGKGGVQGARGVELESRYDELVFLRDELLSRRLPALASSAVAKSCYEACGLLITAINLYPEKRLQMLIDLEYSGKLEQAQKAEVRARVLDTLTQVISRIEGKRTIHRLLSDFAPDVDDPRAWVIKNKTFDEMCLDFMAPLMRGTLSPTLDRGDALARFWTHRFNWYNSTDFNGYWEANKEKNYQPYHPLVIFNTCDAALGSRVVIGFPPLPDDYWKRMSEESNRTHARPKPLNEIVPQFRVSLARAVRLSSNFPFGFRVSELKLPPGTQSRGGQDRLHMLDGGVIDNTGIDTIYELFRGLEWHADPRKGSRYQSLASEILKDLRARGVVILEIDSGTKPSEKTPSHFDPFSGPREPLQSLNNASYTNAEIIKHIYLRDIRSILNHTFDHYGDLGDEANDAIFSLRQVQPKTAFHVVFQCNHYLPGEETQDQEVMTAWALGPGDKAQVVQRFFIQIPVWDENRRTAYLGVKKGLQQAESLEPLARKKILLAAIPPLRKQYEDLAQAAAKGSSATDMEKRKDILDQQLLKLESLRLQSNDEEVASIWTDLQRKANGAALLISVVSARPKASYNWSNQLAQEAVSGILYFDDKVSRVEENRLNKTISNTNQLIELRLMQTGERKSDAQWKLDLSAKSTKNVLTPP